MSSDAPLLECLRIGKTFGGEVALENVDFTLNAGEVHGVVGSNGAGKSTLMKILAGALPDHDGAVLIDNQPVSLSSPLAANRSGVAMVYQELSGIGALSVAENLFLHDHPTNRLGKIDWKTINRRAAEYLAEIGIEIDVRRRLDRYPLAIRQMVEIARGLHSGARILILDEPTSSLSAPECRRLFDLIGQLRSRGVAIVFISHFIEDVLEICDRVTILRDGQRIQTVQSGNVDKHTVIESMLGRTLNEREAGYESEVTLPDRDESKPLFAVKGLSREGYFDDVSFEVAAGECLGLYGFAGAGHQELAHALSGALRIDQGTISLADEPIAAGNVHAAVGRGVVLVAADRRRTLVGNAPIYKNVTLASLKQSVGEWIRTRREVQLVEPLLSRVGCQPAIPQLAADHLSGGNQQKIVLAKWLLRSIRVLVLEEPTRGMDVGAKQEIMNLVAELKQSGTAVVLASTEPELLLAYADRIIVFGRRQAVAEFSGTTLDKATLMKHA